MCNNHSLKLFDIFETTVTNGMKVFLKKNCKCTFLYMKKVFSYQLGILLTFFFEVILDLQKS